jgi:hypothetical protein
MRKLILVPAVAGLLALLPSGRAAAYGSYVDTWRTHYPEACSTLYQMAQNCTLCHNSGFSLNAYADDLASNGIDFTVVGLLDSDSDGRTNDQEIRHDCTAPADAVSPAEDSTWSQVKALFE